MIIKKNEKYHQIKVADITPGEVFIHNTNYYMKTFECFADDNLMNAVDLVTGNFKYFCPAFLVEPCEDAALYFGG